MGCKSGVSVENAVSKSSSKSISIGLSISCNKPALNLYGAYPPASFDGCSSATCALEYCPQMRFAFSLTINFRASGYPALTKYCLASLLTAIFSTFGLPFAYAWPCACGLPLLPHSNRSQYRKGCLSLCGTTLAMTFRTFSSTRMACTTAAMSGLSSTHRQRSPMSGNVPRQNCG